MGSLQRCLDALLPLGFTESQIRIAWDQVGGEAVTIEEVANFMVLAIEAQPQPIPIHDAVSTNAVSTHYKLVLVVNSRLNMSPGKIAAQCSHATLGAVLNFGVDSTGVQLWRTQGEPIIVVQSGLRILEDLDIECASKGLPTHKIFDAGRTEVASGSFTVLAVGPAPVDSIDGVTRSLSLL